MEDELIHELSAAYALNALEPDEERTFEAHLATCKSCQEHVAAFASTTAALGYAAPPAHLPPDLRGRVLDAARAERGNVVPSRGRAYQRTVTAIAAVAAAAAIVLGIWVATSHGRAQGRLAALPLTGAHGSVVLAADGEATLVVSGLSPAPAGKTYEAWVIRNAHAEPAGLFTMHGGTAALLLTRHVPRGAIVAVTLEHAGGSLAPSGGPLVTSRSA